MPQNDKKIHIVRQPTETSCGPTCLHAVYNYYDCPISIETIIDEVPGLPTGGTLAVHLGNHALANGFDAKLYTFNLSVFDPTWFYPKQISSTELIAKLKKVARFTKIEKTAESCQAYIDFLSLGGKIGMEDLSTDLILGYLLEGIPILAGLSSTYLYRAPREHVMKTKQVTDDVRGTPEGHFVVLERANPDSFAISVADPYSLNPYSGNLRYTVPLPRLKTAMLLGVLTYDGNLLVIQPKKN